MKRMLFLLLFCFIAINVSAETVVLNSGRVVDGHIIEVSDEFIRMYVVENDKIIKLRFRNMNIDSAEKYRDYEPKPFDVPEIKHHIVIPKTDRDYVKEGLDFASKGKYEAAIESFDEAIDIRNEIPDFYMFRGGAYQELGKLDEAAQDYTKALSRDPNNADIYARRGWLYQTQGKKLKAIEDYSRVLDLDPYDQELLFERYNLYKETEQWWKAKDDIDYIILFDPEFGDPYLDQAFLNYRVGSFYNAWRSVYDASKRGMTVPPDFVSSLSEKMVDPFLREKPKPTVTMLEEISIFYNQYKIFLLIALIFAALGVIVLLIPSKKKERDALKEAIEEEENTLRMVSFVRAGILRRVCAALIDLILFSVISWAVQIMTTVDIFAAVLAGLFLFKDGIGGESIGKSLMGLRVIDEHGYHAAFFQGFIRNFMLSFPLIIFYVMFWGENFRMNMTGRIALLAVCIWFLVEGVVILLSKKEGRRIGDRMAGTYVHDLRRNWKRWPFGVLVVVLFFGFLIGSAVLNVTFHKAFVYRLNPMRYYNIERDFSFKIPKGWKVSSEGDGGIVFEHSENEGTMVLVMNQEATDYALSLCATAFTRSMEEDGMILRTEEKIEIAGREAFKRGLMDPTTDSGVFVAYFKKDDWGELYIFQVTSPRKKMQYVMKDATVMLESFRFE